MIVGYLYAYQMADTDLLVTHLWDLRAQAEAKLRCLTRVQQLLAEYGRCVDLTDRARKRDEIINDVNDIAAGTSALRAAAEEAVAAAKALS